MRGVPRPPPNTRRSPHPPPSPSGLGEGARGERNGQQALSQHLVIPAKAGTESRRARALASCRSPAPSPPSAGGEGGGEGGSAPASQRSSEPSPPALSQRTGRGSRRGGERAGSPVTAPRHSSESWNPVGRACAAVLTRTTGTRARTPPDARRGTRDPRVSLGSLRGLRHAGPRRPHAAGGERRIDRRALARPDWIPAFAGMTSARRGGLDADREPAYRNSAVANVTANARQ